GAVRYGGKIGDNLYYRVYGLGFNHDNTRLADGSDVNDRWEMAQGGFRLDYEPTDENTFTLQGDLYDGDKGNPINTRLAGGNVLGRWTHTISDESSLMVQFYCDAMTREF